MKEEFITLRDGEEITIGGIRIKNLGKPGRRPRIKIGIDVEPGVQVLRGELVGREKRKKT